MSISSFNEILRKFIVKFRLVQIFTQKMFRNVNFNLNFIKKRSFRSITATMLPETSMYCLQANASEMQRSEKRKSGG
jgi:hypothetical protein